MESEIYIFGGANFAIKHVLTIALYQIGSRSSTSTPIYAWKRSGQKVRGQYVM
jgi:hypothetical protein